MKKNFKKNIFTPEERAAWQLPKPLTVSEWADRNRYLDPLTSAEPGQWDTNRTPYLRGIMDAFNDPDVEEIVIMASTQVGKTEALLNMIGYTIDEDPGPSLFVTPRNEDCAIMATDRIKPMIELSPTLREHRTSDSDDITKKGIRLGRMILYFSGANSPAGLSSKPVRYLFIDELDKHPKFSGREASPSKLASERTRTFWNRKITKSSTPTTREGPIYQEFQKTDRSRFYIPCPHCGEYQILVLAQIKLPEGERDPEKIRRDRLAWYECSECKQPIRDNEKNKMMIKGIWCPDGCKPSKEGKIQGEIHKTRTRGFWLNCLYSPWLTFSDILAEFLKSKETISEFMNFVNSWLAEIWEEKVEETTETALRDKVQEYPEGELPAGVLVLTAAVDVQQDYFVIVIRGWGYHEESWGIRALRVESWADVDQIIYRTSYKKADGTLLRVRLCCMDSGYRAGEVYEFCRARRDVFRPVKGVDHLPGAPYTITKIDKNPKTGSPIPGGVMLYRIDTAHYKDNVSRLINNGPNDLSQWHLYQAPEDEYFRQMTSEQKVLVRDKKTGKAWHEWKKKTEATQNHFWDCEVYNAAAADMIYVSAMRPPNQAQEYQPRQYSQNKFVKTPGGWLQGRQGWVKR